MAHACWSQHLFSSFLLSLSFAPSFWTLILWPFVRREKKIEKGRCASWSTHIECCVYLLVVCVYLRVCAYTDAACGPAGDQIFKQGNLEDSLPIFERHVKIAEDMGDSQLVVFVLRLNLMHLIFSYGQWYLLERWICSRPSLTVWTWCVDLIAGTRDQQA